MYGICINLRSTTASYRDSSSQLYHETLPLPTPTTMVGLAGAAMGMNNQDAMDYFKKNEIMVGCRGSNKGMFRDLWNYNKIKGKKNVIKDIIVREYLYDNEIQIYFSSENKEAIDFLKNSMEKPVYAITLGNSDDLACIRKINYYEDIKPIMVKDGLQSTWIFKDCYSKVSVDWDEVSKLPVYKSLQPPLIKRLPTVFSFDKNGVRSGSVYTTMTYLNKHSVLDEEIEVYKFDDDNVPLYSYGN